MQETKFWRWLAVIAITIAIYLGGVSSPTLTGDNVLQQNSAHAGVSAATDATEMLFTCSEDGRTLFVWKYRGAEIPKYVGQVQAVLNQ